VALPIPQTIDEISAEWIDVVLRGGGVAVPGRVTAIQATRIGVEIGFLSQTADYRFEEALGDFRLAVLYSLLIPIRSFGLVGPGAGGRTGRLVDCIADRIFASALELDAATALD
jgi:hypothetical protein